MSGISAASVAVAEFEQCVLAVDFAFWHLALFCNYCSSLVDYWGRIDTIQT